MTVMLSELFSSKQQELLVALQQAAVVSHSDDKGDISEGAWRTMLSKLLPARYQVSKATIIDWQGGKSDALDVVIHDRHFSPLVFSAGGVTYIRQPALAARAALPW